METAAKSKYPWHKPMGAMRDAHATGRRFTINLQKSTFLENMLTSANYLGLLAEHEHSAVTERLDIKYNGKLLFVGDEVDCFPGLRCTEIRINRHPFDHWRHEIWAYFYPCRFMLNNRTQRLELWRTDRDILVSNGLWGT